ncbi:SRPBCC domain-containing protein [Agreia sp.]|uniref:SRPBCC family protein n=1 Tax=Agreia sp. TaxID=1872416 RepID=UPI0035BC6BDE
MVLDAHAATLRPRRAVDSAIAVRFSPSLVWACLVDPVLIDGWLAHVLVDDAVGGRFAVVWPTGEPHVADWFGTIVEIEPSRRLVVSFAPHTRLVFEIEAGRTDARSSLVRVRHESFLTAAEERALHAFWHERLDNLRELLRGRPVEFHPPQRS